MLIKYILFIIIILIILNNVQIIKDIDDTDVYEEEYTQLNQQNNIKEYNLLFGKDQYILNKKVKVPYYYQNIKTLNKNKKFELTDNLDFSYDEKKILDDFQKETLGGVVGPTIHDKITLPSNSINAQSSNHELLPSKTNPPLNQKMLYDYKLEEPQRKKLEKIIKEEDINYDNKTIKQVYEDLIIDYKKLNPQKKLKNNNIDNNNNNKLINGAFGESSFNHLDFEYEDDTDDFGFDPRQTLELALPQR